MNERDCNCPFCDGSMPEEICSPCEVRVGFCPACGAPRPKDAGVCAKCGERLKEDANNEEA